MNMIKTWSALLFLVALFAAITLLSRSQASAAVIEGVTIEDVSSEDSDAVNAINGSGGVPVNSADSANRHDWNPGNMWRSKAFHPAFGDPPVGMGCCGLVENGGDPHAMDTNDNRLAHITFDLGAVHNVESFVIWPYNEDHGSPDHLMYRGAKNVKVYTSTTDALAGQNGQAGGTLLQDIVIPAGAGRPDIPGEVFNIPFTGRYVRLDVLSNYALDSSVWPFDGAPSPFDETFAGISEIRFDGTVIPEPSCCSLGILGLLSLGIVGRRRVRK